MKCLQSNLTNSSISTYLSFQMTVLQIFHDKEKRKNLRQKYIFVKNYQTLFGNTYTSSTNAIHTIYYLYFYICKLYMNSTKLLKYDLK